ncbi:DNA polymerase III, tau subunit [Desulforamulus reducens MI-1]|uniref:DNA-directed DNA polymerase n=1 Tax=Desulforamulus reducens (strain ATCC BAA-1160 / DSM 100696 / MI-1) TaxID=349161 RepID=A4J0I9_DESRM|nr:DNA polymerase III subunit gamma/tau [Desulforamulus reducens]ABO48592.1 DNA polymerase III, tau subunit [Desulforamulus reducens MI-1]
MAYKALYRTWRPQYFSDIVGQRHITRTLQNALLQDKVAHAYLFCGPRGTGKTTTAKVLAKALNCLVPTSGEPCNDCENCRAVNEGNSVDVVEIDAASNRGIDEIRDLREKVKFAPSTGEKKVYIIDEVHMLTDQAFNALLKTLEEPPSHVVFVLATTEAHKVPVTILSRCQRFDFRRIKPDEMVGRLQEVAQGANIEVEEEALQLIAKAAEGGLRDALSILDQGAAFAEKTVTTEDIHSILGTVKQDILVKMTHCLAEGKAGEALKLVAEISNRGKDLRLFGREMTSFLRGLLVEGIEGRHTGIGNETLFSILQVLVQAEQEMKWSSQPALVLELALVKAARPEIAGTTEALSRRVAELEKRLEQGVVITAPRETVAQVEERTLGVNKQAQPDQTKISEPVEAVTSEPLVMAKTPIASDSATAEKIKKNWPALMKGIKEGKKMPLWSLLNSHQPDLEVQGHTLIMYFQEDFDMRTADKPEYRKYMEWLLGKHFDGQWEVRCVHGKKSMPRSAPTPENDPVYTEAVRIFGKDIVYLENDPD